MRKLRRERGAPEREDGAAKLEWMKLKSGKCGRKRMRAEWREK